MYIAPENVLLLHRCPFPKSQVLFKPQICQSLIVKTEKGYFDEMAPTTALVP